MKASAQAIDRHISAVAHPLPIAAITYDGHAVADALLADFALGLQHKGWRIRGLVQRDTDGSKAGMMLVDLEKGTRYPLFQALGPASCSCALDTESIAAASAVLIPVALISRLMPVSGLKIQLQTTPVVMNASA